MTVGAATVVLDAGTTYAPAVVVHHSAVGAFVGRIENVSLFTVQLLGGVAAAAIALGVAALLLRRPRIARAVLASLSGLAFVLTLAALVNDYFAYFPTVSALLGRSTNHEVSPAQLATAAARFRAAEARAMAAGTASGPQHGLVERVPIPGVRSHFSARPAEVYLPPAWFRSPRPQLPVLILLNGTPGSPQDWTRGAHAERVADAWAERHDGFAPLVVMPDVNGSFFGDTECVDSGAGNAETYLSVDVPAWIQTHLGSTADGQRWAVGGLSEGGYCSLALALRHPDRFGTFLDFGGLDRPTFGGFFGLFGHTPRRLRSHSASVMLDEWRAAGKPGLAGWLETGTREGGTSKAVHRVAREAGAAGLPVHLVVVPGARHTFRLWHRSLVDSMPWLVSRIGPAPAVPPPTPVAAHVSH